MKKRVLFMGTPDFAVSLLQVLIDADIDMVAVITQPDKPVGRKQVMMPTPVKKLAFDHHIPVYQPLKIKELTQFINDLDLDLIVTCAYGQFIPMAILEAPRSGSVNVHASLLPKYRGGAPIHRALISGDKESGITLMRMVKQMDAGELLAKVIVPITEDDDVGSLHDKLKGVGAELLKDKLEALLRNELQAIPQDETQVSFAYNISPDDEFVSFKRNVSVVYDHIRGLSPWPVGYGLIEGKKLKLIKAFKIIEDHHDPIGQFVAYEKGLKIACEGGYVVVTQCQAEGKEKMEASSFYNGLGKSLLNRTFE